MKIPDEAKTKQIVEKIKKNKEYNKKYISKKNILKRIKNSQEFSNVKKIRDDGIIELKTGEYACLLEIEAIDLSLTSKQEKTNFFFNFKEFFKIKNLNLKCIKLDKKINLNPNKENYKKLINSLKDDKYRINLLNNNYELIEFLEDEQLTLSSSYYFVLIAKDIDTLNKQLTEIEVISQSVIPKMYFTTPPHNKIFLLSKGNCSKTSLSLETFISAIFCLHCFNHFVISLFHFLGFFMIFIIFFNRHIFYFIYQRI